MKKCPICGKEYEEGVKCPTCNMMLIDLESGHAVNVDKKERHKFRETKRGESGKVSSAGSGFRFSPVMLLGIVLAVIVIAVIGSFILRTLSRNHAAVTTVQPDNSAQKNSYPAIDSDENDIANSDLNEQDFADNSLEEIEGEGYTFSLPEYWENLCTSKKQGDALYFYQNRSRDADGKGYLFSIQRMEEAYYRTEYTWLAEADGYVYALVTPETPAYDTEDSYAELEYQRLSEDLIYVENSFLLSDDGTEGDYIFPESGEKYLSQSDLEGMSAQELSYARNEIYARHGRKFKDAGLQSYFDSKDWYTGTIEPDDFSETMLNQYEKANAEFILAYEKQNGYIN